MNFSFLTRTAAVVMLLLVLLISMNVSASPYKKYTRYTRAVAHGRNKMHRPSYTPYNKHKHYWLFGNNQ